MVLRKLSWAILLAVLLPLGLQAQSQADKQGVWRTVDEARIPATGERYIVPRAYKTLSLDLARLANILAIAPLEGTAVGHNSTTFLDLPMPDGSFKRFRIVESPVMETALAQQFPEIETFAGVDVEDPSTYVRFDLTPQGFHAMIMSPRFSTVFIDPYSFGGGDITHYIVYHKRDFRPVAGKEMLCEVQGNATDDSRPAGTRNNWRFGDCRLRTYRLALAATGEYTTFHGGTVAQAQAAQVTTINRVTGIFEREMAIRLVIIGNNSQLIYTNAGTDPYTNGTPNSMITENQTNVTNLIGSANYDIGHVFGTNSGGLAGLGVVCTNNSKARGVTGSAAPVGDPFDVDYVAHEMGHQFGANHTFNNSCSNNRNAGTAYEPGSGSSIMSYAGICAPDVQNAVHDNYIGASLQEMSNLVTSAGHTCPTLTNLSNTAPSISAPAGSVSYSIPISTPFYLRATATDPNNNVLTYSWEQMNNNISTQPPVATATGGPNFRALSPSTSPTRYFPNLADLASGAATTWEVLPSVARTMNFMVTVRDNAVGGGCTSQSSVSVTTVAAAGPFVVTAPTNTGITWAGTTNQTVTWNVAGTTASPISCANVDILLSTDGGLTYPIVLASNTPNDGTQTIIAPNLATTTARVQVVCSNNIFFDISNNNFTITAASNDYTITATPTSLSVCPPSNAVYTINIGTVGTFSNPVTLSASGLPAGLTASFSATTVTPSASSTLTISGTNNVAAGTYQFAVTANSSTGPKTINLTLVIAAGSPSVVTLAAPTNGATNVSTSPTFTWSASAGSGIVYQIDIATDANFSNIVATASNLTTTTFTPSTNLSNNTTYYWRVRPSNSCAAGSFSAVYSFTTNNVTCYTFTSTNVPVTISATGISTATSTLSIPSTYVGTITDVNVTNLVGTHTYIQDLVVRLTGPTSAVSTLFRRTCTSQDDFNVKFDDAAASATLPCPPTTGGTFIPSSALSVFNGLSAPGNWTLTIIDSADVDGGTLTAWAIEVCIAAPVCNMTASTAVTSNYNGAQISCFGAANGRIQATAASGTAPYTYLWNGGATTATLSGLAAGTYTVTVSDAAGCRATSSVTLNNPSQIMTTSSVDNIPTCFGAANGQARAAATGGATPYTFIWSNGQTTATATGLVAGFYAVTAVDANGCQASSVLTITQPSGLSVTASSTNATCNGLCNGTASAQASGATAPYTFRWSAANQTTQTATGLCAGTHTLTVTDANGCNLVYTVQIAQPSAISLTSSSTNPTCAGGCNGTATGTVSGGTGAYTFLWSNGRTTNINTGLCAGIYRLTATDANGCTALTTQTLTQPSAMTVTASSATVACFGNCTGVSQVSALGGTAPYSFVWSNNQATNPATGLCAGTYTVTASDANGCMGQAAATISQPAAINANATGTNVSCALNDGAASITASGGTGTLTFRWANNATNSSISGLTQGTYNVSVTDANSCQVVRTATVGNGCSPTVCAITVSAASTNVSCSGQCNGSVATTVTGGAAPITYLWSTGSNTVNAANLCAATYTVTVTDANNCTATTSAVITQPSAISVSASSTNATCNGVCNGTGAVSASGGVSPYAFLWSAAGQTTQTATGLCAGLHTVTVTDANACVRVVTVQVGQPSALSVAATSTNITCASACDGAVLATANGGTSPYAFSWTGFNVGPQITGLCPGTYTATVSDARGCTAVSNVVVVNQPAAISTSASATPVSCALNDGTASINATGGTAPFAFLWATNATSSTISNLTQGVYSVTVTDANGCRVVDNATVSNACQPCAASLTLSSTNISCAGSCDGGIMPTTSNTTGALSFAWSNGSSFSSASGLCAGVYSLSITDANGCTASASATITAPSSLAATITNTANTCFGECTGIATVVASGGTAPYSFLWLGSNQTGATASGLCQGPQVVMVTDANGCQRTVTANIGQNNQIQVAFSFVMPSQGAADGTVSASATGGIAPFVFVWNTGATTSTITGIATGTYEVTVTDARGCSTAGSLVLQGPTALELATAALEGVRISPNPAQSSFDIVLQQPIAEEFAIQMYDALGRVVYDKYIQTSDLRVQVPVQDLPSATYFVKIITKSAAQTTRKVIILR